MELCTHIKNYFILKTIIKKEIYFELIIFIFKYSHNNTKLS